MRFLWLLSASLLSDLKAVHGPGCNVVKTGTAALASAVKLAVAAAIGTMALPDASARGPEWGAACDRMKSRASRPTGKIPIKHPMARRTAAQVKP